MTSVISFIQHLPGAIIDLATDHPFVAGGLGLVALAAGYVGALKVKLAADEARDVRNRNRDRW